MLAKLGRSTLLAPALSLLLSCAKHEHELRVFPLPAESGSLLIALESNAAVKLSGYDLDPSTTSIHLPDLDVLHAGQRVTAMVYDQKLADLSCDLGPGCVHSGTIAAATSADLHSVSLPQNWRAVYQLDPDRTGSSAWTEIGAPSDPVKTFKIPAAAGACDSFQVRGVDFPATYVAFALPIDADNAFVASDAGNFIVHRDGSNVPAMLVPVPPKLAAGTIDAGGEYWLCSAAADGGSEIRHGRPTSSGPINLTLALTSTTPCPRYLATGVAGGKPELYYLALDGRLDRVDATSTERLHLFPSPPGSQQKGSVLWLGPRSIAAARGGSSYVLFWDNGNTRMETPAASDLVVLADVPGFGILAGNRDGQVLQYKNPGWSELVMSSLASLSIYSIAPYDLGFLFGGQGGSVSEYSMMKTCPDVLRAGFRAVIQIIPLGQDALIVYDNYDGTDRPIAVLHKL